MIIDPVSSVDLQRDRAEQYRELSKYEIDLPNEPLNLGLPGVAEKMVKLDGLLWRLQGMLEDAQRQFTICDTTLNSLEEAHRDTLAIMIYTGVSDIQGNIIITTDSMQKMKSALMQEASCMRNVDFARLAFLKREAGVNKTLAKGFLDAVKSRYDRLTKVGYTLNALKEILLQSFTGTFPSPARITKFGDSVPLHPIKPSGTGTPLSSSAPAIGDESFLATMKDETKEPADMFRSSH